MVTFSQLEKLGDGKMLQLYSDRTVTTPIADSRKVLVTEGTVFFAIAGERHDGHEFITDLYNAGVRQFVIERPIPLATFPEGNFLVVQSSLSCLQSLVAHHRSLFNIPVIGITGSNGKTIIKEWLYQLLSNDYNIVKNPGSYNSQLGVPLSVWAMDAHHQLGIFEAGISMPEEMGNLQKMIKPSIGLFTNLGPAHAEGFKNPRQKVQEKLKLFKESEVIIYCKDHALVADEIETLFQHRTLSWGTHTGADIRITTGKSNDLNIAYKGKEFSFQFPFQEEASRENASHCLAVMLHLGYSTKVIRERIEQLRIVPMRLELKQGINHCQIIDDTYNNDLAGLQIGLNFLTGLQKRKHTLILSDILQSGLTESALMRQIGDLLQKAGINRFIGIGPCLAANKLFFEKITNVIFFHGTEEFLTAINWTEFQNEAILVKGARVFQFEKIVTRLQKKIHGTSMEIDLGAMVNNLNFFKAKLKPGVKLMVMVKAFAYGSGSEEVAGLLQYHKVDYLGVAYADEGVELRNNHIRLPIMVMNPSEESFATLLEYHLEPGIYSLSMLRSLSVFLNGKGCLVHLKLDSGMHRLGLEEKDLNEAMIILKAHPNIRIVSIFSHLAGADESAHDAFTRKQALRFLTMADTLSLGLGIQPIRHLLNSPGLLRFPDLQLDMVRLGIGLYGIAPIEKHVDQLQPVATLKTVISQIRDIKSGESIGYGRKGYAEKDLVIATLAIGYADGFSRGFSRGVGVVSVHGQLAPVIGNVCMDMTMIDITGIPAREGDEVIIFGKDLPIEKVAKAINTIPYEILTNTSERVKRVFYAESI